MATIKEVREEKGVKQKAVAQYLGVSRQTYSHYEKHPEAMSIAQAKLVCEFLGCSLASLFLPSEGN